MQRKPITLVCDGCGAGIPAPSPARTYRRAFCSAVCYNANRARPLAERFWEKVDRSGGLLACWEWTASRHEFGYGQFMMPGNRPVHAHRLAYQLATGENPGDLFVCHDCPGGDNPLCCNPAHLFLGTHQENMADARRKGWKARGARNGAAKLTAEQVREIRRRYAAGGITHKRLGAEFGINRRTVGHIVAHERWTHLD